MQHEKLYNLYATFVFKIMRLKTDRVRSVENWSHTKLSPLSKQRMQIENKTFHVSYRVLHTVYFTFQIKVLDNKKKERRYICYFWKLDPFNICQIIFFFTYCRNMFDDDFVENFTGVSFGKIISSKDHKDIENSERIIYSAPPVISDRNNLHITISSFPSTSLSDLE